MLKLYQLEACPFCTRVRVKLAELKVEYEKIDIDPYNRPKIVKDLGGSVPVIDDNGLVMNESSKIIEYLEKKFGK